MRLPMIEGSIRRRVLVNFRIDPAVARRIVPEAFDLELVNGQAMAGICLIRLEGIRPGHVPGPLGMASDNVAYRFAVTTADQGDPAVYIPRRDTSSGLQVRLGGRLFPGEYGKIRVDAEEHDGRLAIDVRSADHRGNVHLRASESDALPQHSGFASLGDASDFFARSAGGYSATRSGDRLHGLLLTTRTWKVEPLGVLDVTTSFFSDPAMFPSGSVEFDDALIMRNVAHEWHALPDIATTSVVRAQSSLH